MAKFSDLTFKYRLFMKTYRYRSYDWSPGARMVKPLSESRIAVVTTAALYRPDQPPFDESIKGGDPSYRMIPSDTELSSLRDGHRSAAFDHTAVEKDKNLALPLDRLRELESDGVIGSVNLRHFSLMGSVTAPGRVTSKSAPEISELLREDGVDAVLLTPV
jgi:D-proline reductase (dithiol) PrdB